MAKFRSVFSVQKMCALFEVSRSGFYQWLNRPGSQRARDDFALMILIKKIFHESRGTYGTPRILAELKSRGYRIGKKRLERLKRILGIFGRKYRKFRVLTTDSKHRLRVSPNLLGQDFSATGPDCVWVSDITYIRLRSGCFVYLCVIMDLFTREIVGWTVTSHMRSELVSSTLIRALRKRKPPAGLIFHSDRGSQYASKEVRAILAAWYVLQSMSRKGNCYDNAPGESIFATLKVEEVYRKNYASIEDVRENLFDYIEVFYNRQRRHSALNFMTPEECFRRFYAA